MKMTDQSVGKADTITMQRFIFTQPEDTTRVKDSLDLANPPFFLAKKEEGLVACVETAPTQGHRFKGIQRDKDTKELDGFGFIFILCIFLAGIGVFSGRSILIESVKAFFQPKDRTNLFTESNDFTNKIKNILVLQTIFQVAYVIFLYFDTEGGRVLSDKQSYTLYGIILAVFFVFILFKFLLNKALILTFSSIKSFTVWKNGQETALSVFGLILLPFTLTVTYLDIPFEHIENVLISLFIGYYSFILLRGLKIFFHTITSYFYVILYLCTVILAPLFGLFEILKFVYDFI
ncbi:MAG: DUF4271 domain-containing protein [Bacteroidales bacterium]